MKLHVLLFHWIADAQPSIHQGIEKLSKDNFIYTKTLSENETYAQEIWHNQIERNTKSFWINPFSLIEVYVFECIRLNLCFLQRSTVEQFGQKKFLFRPSNFSLHLSIISFFAHNCQRYFVFILKKRNLMLSINCRPKLIKSVKLISGWF